MTTGQVVVTLALLATIYGVPLKQPECISWYESRHDVTAVNGIHISVAQWNPDTFYWFLEKTIADEYCPHREYLKAHPTPEDDLSAMILMVWAIKNGYGSHWATWKFCSDIK